MKTAQWKAPFGALALATFLPLGPASAAPQAPAVPTARPSSVGMPARSAPFTLLAVTHLSRPEGFLTPPPAVVAPAELWKAQPVMAGGAGLGLWISTPGGYSARWAGTDGVSLHRVPTVGGRPSGLTLTPTPLELSRLFRVTARPLDGHGLPLGRPVVLLCQQATPTVLFTQVPGGFSAATRWFRVTAARAGAGDGGAVWRIAAWPASVRHGAGGRQPAVTAGFGPLTVRAAAAEAPDYCGYGGFWGDHPARDAGDGWTLNEPLNWDGHDWTGVPTVRVLIAARNTSKDFWGQDWAVSIDRMVPEWSAPTVRPDQQPLSEFPVYNPQDMLPGSDWVTYDWEVGAAYPGQQRWVEVVGAALRFGYRSETLTFHDADVVNDGAFGGERIVWRHPETETTPDGLRVTVLNGRAGVSDESPRPGGNGPWSFDHGSAELLLAWRLPPGGSSMEHPSLTASPEFEPPKATEPFTSEADDSAPLWGALTVPGDGDAGTLAQDDWIPLRLSLESSTVVFLPPPRPSLPAPAPLPLLPALPGMAPLPGAPARVYEDIPSEEIVAGTPTPLPRHLKTITFRFMVKEQRERHPFHLWVPVGAAFPPGWDADAADGRSRPTASATDRP